MICPNCLSTIPDDHDFCGKCGHRLRDAISSLSDRLAAIETRVSAKEQKYLEQEAVENVLKRVKSWTTLFLFFAGIPLAILAVAFAVILGKSDVDLKNVATNAGQSLNAVIEDAKANAKRSVAPVLD